MSAELTHRARKILGAVVQEYLSTGDAVGSRTVTRRYGLELSPATVRNVMADLEDAGLLMQPHTSAGRVPTTGGLRFFIDSLLKIRTLSAKEKEEIRARYDVENIDLDEVLQRASRVLSELSQQAAIVITPVVERRKLERMEFVRLRQGEVLAVLVVEGGQIENRIVRPKENNDELCDSGMLERVGNYLNQFVGGHTLEEVRHRVLEELGKEKNQVDQLAARALALGRDALRPEGPPEVIVSGSANLVDDSARDAVGMTKVRALLAALEEKERIAALLDRTLEADGIQVWLGAETAFARLADLSIIATPYGPDDRAVGSIAVIGPTCMNYSRMIPLVDFTAELVTGALGLKK